MAKRIDLKDVNIYYGKLPRRRRCGAVGAATQRHRVHRPVGLWEVDGAALAEPDARGDPRRAGRGLGAARRRGHLRRRGRPRRRAPHHRHGVPATQPVSHHVDQGQRHRRAAAAGRARRQDARRGRRAVAQGRQPLERGQGPPRQARRRALRRSAAATVHRARDRGATRRAADGRAVFGARSHLDSGDRGFDRRAEARLHDRHRDPQHAAGRPRERPDRVFQPGGHRKARAGWSRSTTPRRCSPTQSQKATEDYISGRFG